MKKRKSYPGSLYDLYGVEQWLMQQAKEGLHLEKFSLYGNLAVFQRGEPRRTRYYLEPDFSQYKTADDEAGALGEEWNFIYKVSGIFLVYATDDLYAMKPSKWKTEETYLRKKWRSLWGNFLLWVVMIALTGGSLIHQLLRGGRSYHDWLIMLPLILSSSALLFFVEFWKGLPQLYDIQVWRRSYVLGEEVDPRPVMRIFRWGEQWLIPIVCAVALLVPILAEAGTTRSNFEFDRYEDSIPSVTLELTEEEIFLAPERYSPAIISVDRHLLIPEDIIIRSLGMYEDPGDEDHWKELRYTGEYDASMHFCYYRLRWETLAVRLAEEEAGGHHSKKVEREDFDDLWLWTKQSSSDYPTRQILVAREDDVVVTITYIGKGSLEKHLSEIYEIVMDYRNH